MKQETKELIDRLAAQESLTDQSAEEIMAEIFRIGGTPAERREAGAYLAKSIARRKRPDVDVKGMLGETGQALNLSYIAKRYFNRDRTWLYQRLNHAIVNGKPASFTQDELKIFSEAVARLGESLQQISSQITH